MIIAPTIKKMTQRMRKTAQSKRWEAYESQKYQLAVSMATKAASLATELKSIKSDLCFMQERRLLLEEENRRLRDGFSEGIRPEEDDLVRPQLEALLADKGKPMPQPACGVAPADLPRRLLGRRL